MITSTFDEERKKGIFIKSLAIEFLKNEYLQMEKEIKKKKRNNTFVSRLQ